MLDTHHLLSTDLFTFTVAGHTWLNQQWAAEVFFAGVWRAGGWNGIAVIWGLTVGAVSLFVFLACRAAGASTMSSALLTLAGYLVGVQISDHAPTTRRHSLLRRHPMGRCGAPRVATAVFGWFPS